MVLNATFNNISAILWRSVLLVEETGVPWENHRPATNHRQTLSLNVVSVHLAWAGFELTTLVVRGTDCIIGSCYSNYYTITTMTAVSGFFLKYIRIHWPAIVLSMCMFICVILYGLFEWVQNLCRFSLSFIYCRWRPNYQERKGLGSHW